MASQQQEPERPVRDDGLAPGDTPFYAGQKYQATAATRKSELLRSGSRTGYIPGRADSPKLASQYVEDAHPYQRATFKPGVTQAGPRPLPREREVYRIDAPGGTGAFVRYMDGHTEHHRERPGLTEYLRSLHPEDDAAERADVMGHIRANDDYWGHKFW